MSGNNKYLEVTSVPSELRFEAGKSSEVQYTVTSRLAADDRVRLYIPAVKGLSCELRGERELEIKQGATVTFTLAVRGETPERIGEFDLRVEALAASSPDEIRASATPVTVSIATPTRKPQERPKGFPMWLLWAAGTLVLVVGAVIYALIPKRDTGAPCAKANDCAGGHDCIGASDGVEGTCLLISDKGCSRHQDCVTGFCKPDESASAAVPSAPSSSPVSAQGEGDEKPENSEAAPINGQCATRPALGAACEQGWVCEEPATCHEKKCLIPEGKACSAHQDCATGVCGEGKTCVAGQKLGQPCEALPCGPGLECGLKKKCLATQGQECLFSEMCVDQFCSGGVCQNKVAPGSPCLENACPVDMVCDEGKACRLSEGMTCTSNNDCFSKRCSSKGNQLVCAHGGLVQDSCQSVSDCGPGLGCFGRKCLVPDGLPCTNRSECIGGACGLVDRRETPTLCRVALREGEACGPGLPDCASLLDCASGKCAKRWFEPHMIEAVNLMPIYTIAQPAEKKPTNAQLAR